MKHVYKYGCHLSSCHIGLSLSNAYVAGIVTSENYLNNSMRNITNTRCTQREQNARLHVTSLSRDIKYCKEDNKIKPNM